MAIQDGGHSEWGRNFRVPEDRKRPGLKRLNLLNLQTGVQSFGKAYQYKLLHQVLFGLFPFNHTTVMCLQEPCISPFARQLCFHIQPMTWAWHCWVWFLNLLSRVSPSTACGLRCDWLRRPLQCCVIVSTFAFFESTLRAHRHSLERAR